jgi:hypothetical protein
VSAREADPAAMLTGLSADEVAALAALRWMVESVAGVRRPPGHPKDQQTRCSALCEFGSKV